MRSATTAFTATLPKASGLQEFTLFDMRNETEYEANAFRAHLRIDGEELIDLMKQCCDWYNSSIMKINVSLMLNKLNVLNRMRWQLDEAYIAESEHYRSIDEVKDAVSEGYWKSYDKFLSDTREEYGTRGVREAKKLITETLEQYRGPKIALVDLEAVLSAMQQAFTSAKREARAKFTPKKYRKRTETQE